MYAGPGSESWSSLCLNRCTGVTNIQDRLGSRCEKIARLLLSVTSMLSLVLHTCLIRAFIRLDIERRQRIVTKDASVCDYLYTSKIAICYHFVCSDLEIHPCYTLETQKSILTRGYPSRRFINRVLVHARCATTIAFMMCHSSTTKAALVTDIY